MQTEQPVANSTYILRTPSRDLRQHAGKYWAILRMSAANHFAYVGEALIRSIFLVLIIFIFVQLWTVTYSVLGEERIGQYTLPQMIWYFAFAEAMMVSVPLLRRKVDDDVKSGEVAYRLGKPYNYVLYLAADYLGEWFARFSLSIAIASGLALIFVGPIPFTAGGLASTLVLLAAAVALDFIFAAAISLLAFWIEDTSSIYLIYRRLVMLLGGMMIPLDVFPEPLSSIARALPFAYIVYGPARQFAAPSADFFTDALLKIGISMAAALAILTIVYRAGQRGVTVNGG